MRRLALGAGAALAALVAATAVSASAATFSNTPLIATGALPPGFTTAPTANSTGDSEPAIAFANDGTMAVDGLGWIPFQVNVWRGVFGSTPSYFGGLDSLVFSGGIGENSPEVRRRACEGLGFLGIALDDERNASGEALISTDASTTKVRVIRTDEESMIAREVIRIVALTS